MPTHQPDPFYVNVRRSILAATPDDLGLGPTDALPRVWGVVYDMTFETDNVTLVALADGSTNVYTAWSRGIVGITARPPVRASGQALLVTAEYLLDVIPASDAVELDETGHDSVIVLTHTGRHRADALHADIVEYTHPLGSLWVSAWGLHRQLRIAQTAIHGPDWTNLRA